MSGKTERCPQCSWLFIGPKPSFCPHCHSSLYWSTDGTESGGFTVHVKTEPSRPPAAQADLRTLPKCGSCGASFIGPAPAICPACGMNPAGQPLIIGLDPPGVPTIAPLGSGTPSTAPFEQEGSFAAPAVTKTASPAAAKNSGRKTPLSRRLVRKVMEKAPGWSLSVALHAILLLMMMQMVFTRQDQNDFKYLEISMYDSASEAEKQGQGDDEADESQGAAEEPVDSGTPEQTSEDPQPAAAAQPEPAGSGESADDSRPVVGASGGESSPASGGGQGMFANRTGEGKGEALKRYGGSARSEQAVAAGLKWLARHQSPQGFWSGATFEEQCEGGACGGSAMGGYDTGHTGVAILCFLGAGHTHLSGDYKRQVGSAIEFILSRQKNDGGFAVENYGMMYNHAVACLALAESYAMTSDARLARPLANGIAFLAAAQQTGGGWDYIAQQTGRDDTSVTGFAVMALKSASAAGIKTQPQVWRKARAWIRKATQADGTVEYESLGFNGRKRWRRFGPGMSAVALLCHLYFGEPAESQYVRKTINQIVLNPPNVASLQFEQLHTNYYWYYATLALFQVGGETFRWWNERFRDMLTGMQCGEGCQAGSWNPDDGWMSAYGGRLYSTTMSILCLEVYYRYLPLYNTKGTPDFGDQARDARPPVDADVSLAVATDPAMPSGKRLEALQAIQSEPGDCFREGIEKCLSDSSQVVRWQAARSLAARAEKASAPALVAAFAADDGQLLTVYVDAMAAIGGRDCLLALAGAAAHPEQRVRTKAVAGLRAATGKDFGEDPAAWKKHVEAGGY